MKNIQDKEKYYPLPRAFWDEWILHTGPTLNNRIYNKIFCSGNFNDFSIANTVFLQKNAYEPLIRWHTGFSLKFSKIKPFKVIKYIPAKSVLYSQNNITIQKNANETLELEIDKPFFEIGKINADGKSPSISCGRIICNFVRCKPIIWPQYIELYVSRRKTVGDLHNKIRKRFGLNNSTLKSRIYIEQILIEDKQYSEILENFLPPKFLSKGVKISIFLEQAFSENQWPTEISCFENNRILTCGLNNLGNSIFLFF